MDEHGVQTALTGMDFY